MSKPLVFIADPISPVGLDALRPHCDLIAPWLDGETVGEIPAEADAVMVRTYPVTAERLAAAPKVRVVAKHGVGIDNIDVSAATERGIAVVWTPEANADAVAQHTLALILGLANRLAGADSALRTGRFLERLDFGGTELTGRTLGIIGLGRIGRRVAHRAIGGLGMEVLAYDPYIDDATPASRVDTLDDLLSQADVVTLHVPLTDETRDMIDAHALSQMKRTALLVNTSRGPVVDANALATALRDGAIAGAGIDVFPDEPPPLDHPLLSAPRALLTPHVAGLSDQALVRVAKQAAEGILDVLQGRRPKQPVNPEVL